MNQECPSFEPFFQERTQILYTPEKYLSEVKSRANRTSQDYFRNLQEELEEDYERLAYLLSHAKKNAVKENRQIDEAIKEIKEDKRWITVEKVAIMLERELEKSGRLTPLRRKHIPLDKDPKYEQIFLGSESKYVV